MKNKKLVICPVYNEGHTLEKFYNDLRKYYREDILFVDDGSTDQSKNFLNSLNGRHTLVAKHPKRLGYGAALSAGFRFSINNGYSRVVTIDTDLQHNAQHIPRFFDELMQTEVVLGSRYIIINECLTAPRPRLLINRYIKNLIKILFKVNITDPFCGYRGYRTCFLQKAVLKEKSYGFGLEIVLELIRTKTIFKEIPVEVIYLDQSRRFLDGLNNPQTRLLHYLKLLENRYQKLQKNNSKLNILREQNYAKKIFSGSSSSG